MSIMENFLRIKSIIKLKILIYLFYMHNLNVFRPTKMRQETCEKVYQKGSKNCISHVRLYIFGYITMK